MSTAGDDMTSRKRSISLVQLTVTTLSLCVAQIFAPSSAAAAQRKPSDSRSGSAATELAAQSPGELAEVIVTAERVRQPVIRVPMSISVYTRTQMDQLGVRDLSDIVQMTPGLQYNGGDHRGAVQQIVIDGVSSNAGAATTSTYINDVPVDTSTGILNLIGTTSARIFDLARVEVLRGPQGTLFGAGSEGGAVRFITMQPSLTNFSGYTREDVSTIQGGGIGYSVGVAVGGPIMRHKLGYRVSLYHQHAAGYVDHQSIIPGGIHQSNANWTNAGAFQGALTYAPNSHVRITPSIFYQQVKTNDSGFFDPSLSNVNSDHFVNGNALLTPINDKWYLPSLKVAADIGPVSAALISSYFHRSDQYQLDYTNVLAGIFGLKLAPSIADAAPVSYGNVQNIETEELRLHSKNQEATLNWVAGVFWEASNQHVTENVYSPGLPQMSLQYFGMSLATAFGYPMIGNYSFLATDIMRSRQIAGYGQVNYRATRKLTLTAGVRYAVMNNDYSFQARGPLEGGVVQSQGGESDTAVTPKYGIKYQLNKNSMLYFSAAEGYRIGGANSPLEATPTCLAQLRQVGATNSPSSYKPDSLWSYEIGSKNKLLHNRLVLTGSGFYTAWNHIQQSIYVPACLSSFIANVGKATIDGFDLTMNAALSAHLHAGLSVGYTNARVAKTTGVPGTSIVYAYKGDQLSIYSSPWMLSAMVEYVFSLEGKPSFVLINDNYHSKNHGPFTNLSHPGPLYNALFQPNPATNLLNVRAGMYLGRLQLTAFLKNALNTHPSLYDLSALGVGGSALGATFTFEPRTIGMEAIYKW